MVIDTSALVAIIAEETGYEALLEKAGRARILVVGAPIAFECAMVLSGRSGRDSRPKLAGLLRNLDAEIVPWNEDHYEAALTAFLRYGKGRHPAKLNFGDCMSYAIAAVAGMPLLYSGSDFVLTDIPAA